jgi:serine/threonine-protein kinase haspin
MDVPELMRLQHRDLHQNNICVSRNEATVANSAESSSKYGRSGFEVTILDYGLSRATLPNGNTVCNDLENDLGIFQGTTGNAQFDTYRR